jgi:hypothetical protein
MRADSAHNEVERIQFREWLTHPWTKRFFSALERDRIECLTQAASHAANHNTGIGNAMEHNRLIRANAFDRILKTYGNPKSYPYNLPSPIDTGYDLAAE